MFATVVHNLKSPENTGMILRTHVAFGGERFVMVGPQPWRFKKRTQAFSRRLEKLCRITYLPDDDALFDWCRAEHFTPVAVEITEAPVLLPSFRFPARPAIIVGHEGKGLSDEFLQRCSHVATIPQFGPVGCLNVAVSCSIAIYELNRSRPVERAIEGHVFAVAESERPEKAEPPRKSLPKPPRFPQNRPDAFPGQDSLSGATEPMAAVGPPGRPARGGDQWLL